MLGLGLIVTDVLFSLFYVSCGYYTGDEPERHKNTAYRRMAHQMKEISASLEENMGIQLLTVQRDKLDSLKEEQNQAFKEYHDTMINEEETQASYQWFDLQDREYTEC